MQGCYLPACPLKATWLVSGVEAPPDESRPACDGHLPRAVLRVSKKHGGQAVAITPQFVIQSPVDLAMLLPIVDLGGTIHGLISNYDRAAELTSRDGTLTGAHLTALPAARPLDGVQEALSDLPIRFGSEDVPDA